MQSNTLTDRSMSLHTAAGLKITKEELEARQMERWKLEAKSRKLEQERVARERSDNEKELLLKKVPLSSVNWGELDPEGEEDSSQNEGDSDIDSDADSDSDWEDFDDVEKTPEYNTLKLNIFARECDRYKASNREGAKLANALLKDLKIVTKKDWSKLICPGKLRRERLKWGGELEKIHSKAPPWGTL